MKLLVCLLCLGSVLAYSLEDVTQSDASYKAIKRGVEQGYFSTFENGQKFYPDRAVSRKEMALILDKVIRKSTASKPLTASERQELGQLAKTFKSYLVQQETGSSLVTQKFGELQTEQESIHYDLSRLQLEINNLEEKNKKQKHWLWGALALGVLGIAI